MGRTGADNYYNGSDGWDGHVFRIRQHFNPQDFMPITGDDETPPDETVETAGTQVTIVAR